MTSKATLKNSIVKLDTKKFVDPTFEDGTQEQWIRIMGKMNITDPEWYKKYYWHANNPFPTLMMNEFLEFDNKIGKLVLSTDLKLKYPNKRKRDAAYKVWPQTAYMWAQGLTMLTMTGQIKTSETYKDKILTGKTFGYRADKAPKMDEAICFRMYSDFGHADYFYVSNYIMRYNVEGTLLEVKDEDNK